MREMASSVEVVPSSPGAGGNGAGVDMQGWDGVAFQCIIGVVGNGGTYDLRVVESANSNFSGAVNVANAEITQVLNTSPNVLVTIDVYRPTNRYLRVVSTPATNNANVAVIAHRYRGTGRTPAGLPTNHQYVAVRAN
jgi:hypothetical protein